MGAVLAIDLRRLNQAPAVVEGEIASDDQQWSVNGVELARPVTVRATAEGSASRGVWVRGSLTGEVLTSCRRCLQPLELAVTDRFELLFDPKTDEADGDLTLYGLDPDADELDLYGPLRERWLLALPAYPLCRDDCAGLCGRCGRSLAEGECECGAAEPDPRWGPLRALKRES